MPIAQVGNYPNKQDYIPQLYSPILLEKFRDNTFMSRVTNKNYEGELRKGGDQIIIRQRPNMKTAKYKKGQTLAVQGYKTTSVTFPVNRSRYYAFEVNDIDRRLSDIKGWVNEWTDEGGKSLAEDNEVEFLADIYGRCHTANAGNAAGLKSGSYDLGSTSNVLQLYNTSQTTQYKSAAVDAIAAAAAALQEQPGGLGPNPWIIIPVWMGLLIQTGELKDASLSGDAKTLLRKEVIAIGNIAGLDVYTSNLLTKDYNTNAPGNYSWNIVYGDTRAITYATQIEKSEVIRMESDFADTHRSLMVYDWFPVMPERFGHMVVAKGA